MLPGTRPDLTAMTRDTAGIVAHALHKRNLNRVVYGDRSLIGCAGASLTSSRGLPSKVPCSAYGLSLTTPGQIRHTLAGLAPNRAPPKTSSPPVMVLPEVAQLRQLAAGRGRRPRLCLACPSLPALELASQGAEPWMGGGESIADGTSPRPRLHTRRPRPRVLRSLCRAV